MGKRTRRLMEGFALGALTEMSRQQRVAFETRQAQEAEALREQRLAAIRAEERQHQDRIYERNAARDDQRFERQLEIEAKRDERELNQQMSAEQRAEERQLRLAREQARIGAEYRQPQNAGNTIMRAPDGTIVSVANDDPRFRAGELKGYELAWDRGTGQSAPAPAATPARTLGDSQVGPPGQYRNALPAREGKSMPTRVTDQQVEPAKGVVGLK